MNARELRIGNIVKRTKTGEIFAIQAIDISSILRGDLSVEGVPLIDKILSEIGFNKLRTYPERDGFEFRNGEIHFCHGAYCENTKPVKHVKYIHQLQNLYFALRDKELIVQ